VKAPGIINIYPAKRQISAALASRIARLAEQAKAKQGRFTVALSGGSLLKIISSALINRPPDSKIDWASWEIFWADERCVPLSSPDSNFAAASSLLFKQLQIPWPQIHVPDTALGAQAAAQAYQHTIQEVLQPGPGRLPRFDLILLGMGQDGHTASLFPGHALLQEKQKWAAPVFDAPKPPPERITLTLPVINQAREVIFVVTGSEKASALRAVLDNQESSQILPAALVNPTHGNLMWFVDQAAAEQLP
jgi:6-phosphogluconolactonase